MFVTEYFDALYLFAKMRADIIVGNHISLSMCIDAYFESSWIIQIKNKGWNI